MKKLKVLLLFLFTGQLLFASLANAKILIKKGNTSAAISELKSVLKKSPKNLEARNLLLIAKKIKSRNKSKRLTQEAEFEINKGNLLKAYQILEKAITLDADNKSARKKHLAIYEILEAEKYSKPASANNASDKMQLTFLDEGAKIVGRKVKILMANGFTIVGLITKSTKNSILVHSETTNRMYEIDKSEIIMKVKTKKHGKVLK